MKAMHLNIRQNKKKKIVRLLKTYIPIRIKVINYLHRIDNYLHVETSAAHKKQL